MNYLIKTCLVAVFFSMAIETAAQKITNEKAFGLFNGIYRMENQEIGKIFSNNDGKESVFLQFRSVKVYSKTSDYINKYLVLSWKVADENKLKDFEAVTDCSGVKEILKFLKFATDDFGNCIKKDCNYIFSSNDGIRIIFYNHKGWHIRIEEKNKEGSEINFKIDITSDIKTILENFIDSCN